MSEKTGRKRTRLLTAAILFGSIVSLLEAAIPTGTVVGTVRDESGAIIPGAKVTITHQGTGAVRSMQTDSSGNYNFPLLPVGTYTLKIEMQGVPDLRPEGISTSGRPEPDHPRHDETWRDHAGTDG